MCAAISIVRTAQEKINTVFREIPVVPVITIDHLEDAVPLAEALVAGGIRHLEITLRTPVALQGAALIAKNVPGAVVGIGTVLAADDLKKAIDIGAQFALSPGLTPQLLKAAAESALPFIPGVSTASEIMMAQEYGYFIMKFFPAMYAGGMNALKAFQGPFPNVLFCPTGGINEKNFMEWRALSNVITVGGSWLTPRSAILSKDWNEITRLAQQALALIQEPVIGTI